MKILIRAALFAFAASASLTASAQMLPLKPTAPATETELELAKVTSLPELLQRAAQYQQQKDMRRYTYAIKRIVELRPYGSQMLWELARAYALQDDKSATYDILIKLQQQGMKYDPTDDKDFDLIRGTPAYKYIVEGLQANATPFGTGKPAYTIDSDVELIESLAHDSKTGTFYAGSILSGDVLKLDAKGGATPWLKSDPEAGHYGVFSMAIDAQRRKLWLGTASVPMYSGYDPTEGFGRTALVEVNLDTGKRIASHTVPFDGKPHVPVAMAVASTGEVYFTDAVVPAIYQLKDGKVKLLFSSPALTGLRGIAVSADHKNLYFSDYETGLYGADLGKNQVYKLSMEKQNLGGIDGLYLKDNILYALQNGSYPQRIIRALIDPANPRELTLVFPLEANKPELVMPSFGVIAGDELHLIANSQISLYRPDGSIIDGQQPVKREVFVSSLKQPLPEPKKPAPRAPAAPKLEAAKPAN
jgi:hypothetical protein